MKKIILVLLLGLFSYYFLNNKNTEITSKSLNSTPESVSQNIFLNKNSEIDIFLDYKDIDQDNVLFEIIDYPNYGKLSGENRNWRYESYADFSGDDYFTYRVYDGQSYSEKSKISIKVLNNNIELIKELKNKKLVEERDKKRKYQLSQSNVRVGTPKKIQRGIDKQIAYKEPEPREDDFGEIEEQNDLEEISDQIESEENDVYVNEQIQSYLDEFQLSERDFKDKFNSLKNKIMNKMLRERNSRSESSLSDYRTRIVNQIILEEGSNSNIELKDEINNYREESFRDENVKEENYSDDNYNENYSNDEYNDEYIE